MKAFLHHALIKTKIKEGFLVFRNNTFRLVSSVNGTEVYFPDGTSCDESELEGSVVKLLAIVSGSTPYSVFNADYDKVLDILSEPNDTYGNLTSYLDNEKIDLVGTIIRKTVGVQLGEFVRLTNIRHIDKFSLYEYASRTAQVIDYKDYYYHLRCGTYLIKCKREDFTVIEGENLRSFFQIQCKHCKR